MCGIIGYKGKKNAVAVVLDKQENFDNHKYSLDLKHSKKVISMNILNLIKKENYYVIVNHSFQQLLKQKISNYSETSRMVGVSSKTIARILNNENYWMNFQTLLNISDIFKIPPEELFSYIQSIKTHNSFPIRFNIKNLSSKALFRVIGHILGDGGIHVLQDEDKYRPFYTNKNQELIDSFVKDIYDLFGETKLYKRTKKTGLKEIWLPTTLGHIFYVFMEYEQNSIKRVPSFVFKINDYKLLCALLQALYDDEGFLYPKKNMIVIAQKHRALIEDIRQIVTFVGIRPNQILIHKSKSRTTMHYFSITGKENILKFYQDINFIHPIKRLKLEELKRKYI